MDSVIKRWNKEKGFGWVVVGGREWFVHATAITPKPARGADLNGVELDEINTGQGKKGPAVVSARVVPMGTTWELSTLYAQVECRTKYPKGVGDRWDTYSLARWEGKREGIYWDWVAQGIAQLDPEAIAKALDLGCPKSLIEEARAKVQELAQAKAGREETFAEAVRQAAAMAGEGLIPLVIPRRPKPTQWLEPKCVERFNNAWEGFSHGVSLGGSNSLYSWGTVSEGTPTEVKGEYGDFYLTCTWEANSIIGDALRKFNRAGIRIPRVSQGDRSPVHRED